MAKTIRKLQHPAALLPEKKRVAAYARVSSGKDAMLHSLSAQISYYSEYIQRNPNWEFVGIYADEAETGTRDSRPEFKRLLADCKAGLIDMVITKSISRFARNTLTLLQTTRELKALGVDVFFEEQGLHTNSGEGEMILTLLASVSQEESRSVSENCKWRIRNQFKNGELANLRFMYGYKVTKAGVEIDEERAEIVRMIFNDYNNGMGGYSIAKKLNETGVATYIGNTWSPKRVLDIIKNEKYTGNSLLQKSFIADHLSKVQIHNKGQLPMYFSEGTHTGIIDEHTFKKAQEIMGKRRDINMPYKAITNRYPFSGKIKCPLCGKNYRRKTTHGKISWNCSTFLQHGKKACHGKQIPESVLYQISSEVLEIPAFDEDKFASQIKEMIVPKDNTIRFVFHDGSKVEKIWRDRSRRESWTEEMRSKARNASKNRGNA